MSIFLSRAQLCANTSGGYHTKPGLIHEGAAVEERSLCFKVQRASIRCGLF